ncbi:hypothetical protein SLS63_005823 [Diaporthe eres]|uniref:Xylanolytic transcriptional activator regulatory domain-containing protein n=1 Tax=Diaporthe eres TaxID=83184 RepID=A0ABR1P9M9_DIAER
MNGVNAPPAVPTLAPTPGLLTGDIVKECIEFFFANMYPNMPVLSRHRLEQQAVYMDQNLDTYCLLAALSAFMMIQPGMSIPGDPYGLDSMPGANIVSSTVLLEEAIRVRKGYDYTENPTLNTLCTSYFLFACFNGLEMHEKAWFHLREAATMIHIIGMNKEEAYIQFDDVESSRRRRLYWLFFVTERPVTLQASINPPALGDDPTDHMAHQLNSFIHLSNLFRPFDDAFLGMWSKNRSNWPSAYLNNLHKQLAEIIPAFHSYGDSQYQDIRHNQQWLKTMIWQLNSNGGHGEDQTVLQQYSANMASNLLAGISSMPQQNSESLNVSFLFDVACSLTEVLVLYPASRDPFSPGPHEQLNPLLNVLTVLRNGDYRFVPLLISKINETLPKLANPMLQNVPDNVATKACNMDIFDGFGNAGMAQPPLMDDYEKKYTPRMEEAPVDSGSSQGGSVSNHEMNSPFMSSPPATSPGGEYSHGLTENNYNSMSGIMMNPMGAPSSMNGQPPAPTPQQTPHTQHQPQQSISSMQNINTHMQHDIQQHGLGTPLEHPPNMSVDHQNHNFGQQFSNGIAYMNAMSQGMNTNNLVSRQGPSRTSSFAMGPNQHTIRTVADFQALQRANSDISTMSSLGLNNGLGAEMDFMR